MVNSKCRLSFGDDQQHDGTLPARTLRNNETLVFQYEPSKHREALVNKLGDFSGILVADAESRHNPVFTDGSILEAGCNAHGRRKFEDAESVQPILAVEGGRWIGAIYGEEERARELGLKGDDLKKHRQTFTPLKESLRKWMDSVKPGLVPSDPQNPAIQYYENHWDALFRFVDHPELPIDNSATEREFQNVAKRRLNMLFAGSTKGAHRATAPTATSSNSAPKKSHLPPTKPVWPLKSRSSRKSLTPTMSCLPGFADRSRSFGGRPRRTYNALARLRLHSTTSRTFCLQTFI